MTSTAQAMINRSVSVEGYAYPIAYKPQHDVSYGYWICKECISSFFGGGAPIHEETCQRKSEVPGFSPDIIYVFGDNEIGDKDSGYISPLKVEDIERIKALAKQKI